MKITFLGAAHEVTGSCSLIEVGDKKILIDCGMEQGADIYENCELPVLPADIDAICLTHAHIDHSGKLPALVAAGYEGPIYTTAATARLCGIMLRDSAHIQEFEAQWRNRKLKRSGGEPYVPLYTVADAEKTMKLFRGYSYNREVELFEGVTAKFIDAGHLLGSASIHLTLTENGNTSTVLFSGDLGNVDRPLIRDPENPEGADYVVIESTYGDRDHPKDRPDYVGQLSAIIQETFDRGGNVVIPSFAIGRTQELLYLIRTIKEKGIIRGHDNFPVYVDSPLAVEATGIYSGDMTEYFDSETLQLLSEGINPISFANLNLSVTSDDSKLINEDKTPKVILSASGMCEAGRIRHHLKHNLWRNDSTILFVGYQAEGTIGRKLIDGEPSVKLFGEEITVNARIASLEGISGHADRGIMLSWLGAMNRKPRKVFVNHGADTVCEVFAENIARDIGIEVAAPFSGDCFDLLTGVQLERGRIVRIQKSPAITNKKSAEVFNRLLNAGRMLMTVIEQNRHSANKDNARFAEQILALCEKYKK